LLLCCYGGVGEGKLRVEELHPKDQTSNAIDAY